MSLLEFLTDSHMLYRISYGLSQTLDSYVKGPSQIMSRFWGGLVEEFMTV